MRSGRHRDDVAEASLAFDSVARRCEETGEPFCRYAILLGFLHEVAGRRDVFHPRAKPGLGNGFYQRGNPAIQRRLSSIAGMENLHCLKVWAVEP